MFCYKNYKNILLLIIFILNIISLNKAKQININENRFSKFSFLQDSRICASTSYSKNDIQKECKKGPNSYIRMLRYNTFENYINNHNYHKNGLNYITSLLVDSETHHYGNFMNDCAGMIVLYILGGILLLSWIPLLCCWRKKCCLFGDCLYDDLCCIILWHVITYFFAAVVLSFIIIILVFGK